MHLNFCSSPYQEQKGKTASFEISCILLIATAGLRLRMVIYELYANFFLLEEEDRILRDHLSLFWFR